MKNAYTELIESTLNSLIEDERFMCEEFVFYINENEGNATVVDQTPEADTPISSSVVSVDIYIGK